METVVLVLLLILALVMCGLVLLQRSEGGGLGIGGGGGGMGGRPKANPLARLTWIVAVGFMACAIALTILSAQKAANNSIIGLPGATDDQPFTLDGESLLPPSSANDDLIPPAPTDN